MKDAIHFAFSMPVGTLVTGPDNADMLQEKIDFANSFKGMSEEKADELIAKVAIFADRRVEY